MLNNKQITKKRFYDEMKKLEKSIDWILENNPVYLIDFESSNEVRDIDKFNALMSFLTRSYNIIKDIHILLTNKRYTCAYTRWRTFFELSVYSDFLKLHPDSIDRYIDHACYHIEIDINKRKSRSELKNNPYINCPIEDISYNEQEIKEFKIEKTRLVTKYGTEFFSPYGWTIKHFNKKHISFKDLYNEVNADRVHIFHYVTSSSSVHLNTLMHHNESYKNLLNYKSYNSIDEFEIILQTLDILLLHVLPSIVCLFDNNNFKHPFR